MVGATGPRRWPEWRRSSQAGCGRSDRSAQTLWRLWIQCGWLLQTALQHLCRREVNQREIIFSVFCRKSFSFITFNSILSHQPVSHDRGNFVPNDFLFYLSQKRNVQSKWNQFSSVTFYKLVWRDKNAAISITQSRGRVKSGGNIGYEGKLGTKWWI